MYLGHVNKSLNVDYLTADCVIHTNDVKSTVARLNPHMTGLWRVKFINGSFH